MDKTSDKTLIIRDKRFMNTLITFKVVKDNQSTVEILDAIENGFGEFDRIVKSYTRFNEDSELSNLNRKSGEWVEVSREFVHLIAYMLNLSKETDGAFDPTIIDFLDIYGYNKNYDYSNLDNPELDKKVDLILQSRPSWKDIEIDEENRKVKLVKNQKIDLGAIGKGYAIDCAFTKIKEASRHFLIDAGGDIRSWGRNDKDEVWSVGLKKEDIDGKQSIFSMVELNNKALASSGSWARKIKQFHHLINPKTGKPENRYKTVYVMADDAITADSWATTIFVGGDKLKLPDDLSYFTV